MCDMKSNNMILRNTYKKDISQIVAIQRESFPDVAAGIIYEPSFLEDHINLFPEGQFCAEFDERIVASATSLIVLLYPEYRDHTWYDIAGDRTVLKATILMAIVFMQMISALILIFVGLELQRCSLMLERNWP